MDDRAAKVVVLEEEEEEEERVCMQLKCRDYGRYFRSDVETYKWYVDVIDDQAAAAAASNAVEIQGMCREFYCLTGAASSNSTVYVLGGYHPYKEEYYSPIPNNDFDLDSPLPFEFVDPLVTDVWYNDTFIIKAKGDHDHDIYASGGWIKGASMLHSRVKPRTVSMDEKIYVFGGASTPVTPVTWAEVYDIKSDSWSWLPPPPEDLLTDNDRNEPLFVFKCAAFDKLILVYFLGPALYSYDVKLGTWEVLDANFGSIIEHDIAVVSCCGCDTTTTTPVLLTVKEDDGKLYGYHLGKKKWFDSPVNVDGQDNAIPHPDLEGFILSFHLIPMGRYNDKLCYLWSYYPRDHSGLWVHCTKLSFYYDGHSSSLSANVESTNLFKLRHVDNLHSCVPFVTRCRGTKRAGLRLCTEEEEEEEKKNKH